MFELPDFDLAEFLTPGIEPDDVPALWSLVRSRELINTFITLFRGGEEEVFIRLHVLREIGGRADHPRWDTSGGSTLRSSPNLRPSGRPLCSRACRWRRRISGG